MGRRNRIVASLLTLACATSTALANKKAFNIHDDLLAFPQVHLTPLSVLVMKPAYLLT